MSASICSPEFQSSKAELPVVIGRTIQNQPYVFDLAKTPTCSSPVPRDRASRWD